MNKRSYSVSLLMILVFLGLFFSVPSVIAGNTPDSMSAQLTPKTECNYCERQNPQGVCVPDNHKPCDDGDPCTVDDICLGRICRGKKNPLSEDPLCRECNQCERRNPQGICVPDNLKPCDDGNPCTFDDLCFGRVCRGKRDPSPIDPSCRECNPCERLNPQGKCVPDNHKPCDDGDSCTVDDRCLGRVCRGKKDPGCSKPFKWGVD